MSHWKRQQNLKKTENANRWLHACGRKDFNRIEQIKKETYICSLHSVAQKGPTEEHPDPVKADDEDFFERRKRKPSKQRLPLQKKTKKINLIQFVIQEMFPVIMKIHCLLLTLLIMVKLTTPL